MFNLEVNSIETINAGNLSIGEFAIVEEQDSSHNGELICRTYTPDNTVVFLVSITDPSCTWRLTANSSPFKVRKVIIKEVICKYV